MGASIAATAYALMAQGLAQFLLPYSLTDEDRIRAVTIWSIAAVLLFFVHDHFILLVCMFFLLVALAPARPDEKASLFLVATPCIPFYVHAPIPFPGINFLIDISNYKVAAVALLVPLLLQASTKKRSFKFSISDFCLLAYIVYTAAIVGNALNATSGLRFFIDQAITLALPYVALRYAITDLDDFDTCIRGFLIASVILAAIALVATAKQWDFYRLFEPESLFKRPDFRHGFLRIGATANTHSLGYHLAVCFLFLEYIKRRGQIHMIKLMLLRVIFLFALFVTNSRGAMLGLALSLCIYAICLIRNKSLQWTAIVLFIGSSAFAFYVLLTGDFSKFDPHDTFSYRQELMTTSLNYIYAHPFFGDYNFLLSGDFDHLLQGQGIIDVTNLFLQIVLHYGLIGLVLFFAVILLPLTALNRSSAPKATYLNYTRQGAKLQTFIPITFIATFLILSLMFYVALAGQNPFSLTSMAWLAIPAFLVAILLISLALTKTRPRSQAPREKLHDVVHARAIVAGTIIGWLSLVATTSDFGLTIHLGIMLAAFARALAKMPSQKIHDP